MDGAIGNENFRFYMREIAEGITLTGQTLLKRVDKSTNNFMNGYLGTSDVDYVCAQDTDSNYMDLSGIVNKHVPPNAKVEKVVEYVDQWHKKNIAPLLTKVTTDMQDNMNVYEHRLKFVRDVISDNSIFLAKKRYVMQVWDVEGVRYTKPQMKIMGVESVKSSTPEFCKNKINTSIDIMLNKTNDDLIEFVSQAKSEFMKLPVEEISSPRGITNLDKWVDTKKSESVFESYDEQTNKSGTPIHVKGAINYNKNIDKFGLSNKYTKLTNGDKIKFVYLKLPNPTGFNTIAFDEELPTEFKLHSYVDYSIQCEKVLLSPIKSIADIIGWTMEKEYGLF